MNQSILSTLCILVASLFFVACDKSEKVDEASVTTDRSKKTSLEKTNTKAVTEKPKYLVQDCYQDEFRDKNGNPLPCDSPYDFLKNQLWIAQDFAFKNTLRDCLSSEEARQECVDNGVLRSENSSLLTKKAAKNIKECAGDLEGTGMISIMRAVVVPVDEMVNILSGVVNNSVYFSQAFDPSHENFSGKEWLACKNLVKKAVFFNKDKEEWESVDYPGGFAGYMKDVACLFVNKKDKDSPEENISEKFVAALKKQPSSIPLNVCEKVGL